VTASIVTAAIDVESLIARVKSSACGAIVTFLGLVRESSPGDPRPVDAIHYDAYPRLALPELETIAQEARTKFGPLEIAIVHRVGDVELGAASIGVAVAAAHRRAAFEACEYAMDEIKARVAVWKQERYRDGATAWRANVVRIAP